MTSKPESCANQSDKTNPLQHNALTSAPLPRTVPVLLTISLALAVLTSVLFIRVREFSFINLDDPAYFSANPHVQAGSPGQNLVWAFRTTHAGFWHPVTWLSHILDAQLFGPGPKGPHLVNLLIHVANVVLLFLLLHRLTGALWRAALVAALFAWHPLRVESVAWVAERKDVLSGFFFILTLWAYVKYSEQRAAKFYVMALALFVLGLMSKPMLVTVPFVLLLLDFWPLCRFQPFEIKNQKSKIKNLILEKLPFFIVSASFSFITFLTQRAAGAVLSWNDCSPPVRIENATISYVRYLGKTFWPFDLATPYSDAQLWPPLLFAVAAAGLLTLTALLLRSTKQPFLAVGWLWFCGMLVPTIGLIQAGAQSMADRFTYLPSIGLFISLVWLAAEFSHRCTVPALARAALAFAVLATCWLRTTDQLQYWQNSEKLLTHTLAATKNNWIAEYNLGWELDQQGREEEALPHYRRVLAVKPFDADTRNNVGCYLVRKKQFADAAPYFESALKAKPGRSELHYNLAHCLFQQHNLEAAIPQYQAFLDKVPNHVEALHEVGVALALSGKLEQAIPVFQRILVLKPNDAQAHFNLGEALALQGKSAEARFQLSEALRLKPDWVEAQNELRALQSETPH